MPRRTRQTDYAGARGRTTLEQARTLGDAWALQPKRDGIYVRITLDDRGCIRRLFSRTGREVDPGDLEGCFVGWPRSELVGELEHGTEAAVRAVRTRGFRLVHLFDCIRSGGRYVAREPYRARRAELWRMQSEVVNLGPDAPWLRDCRGDYHDPESGRYIRPVPGGWRRTPIVPQVPAWRAEELWADEVETGGGEGLVAVRLDARLGARGSKRKIKAHQTLDCRVVAADGSGAARLEYGGQMFHVSTRGRLRSELRPGQIAEVVCDGWYETRAVPRFARVTRVRYDLM